MKPCGRSLRDQECSERLCGSHQLNLSHLDVQDVLHLAQVAAYGCPDCSETAFRGWKDDWEETYWASQRVVFHELFLRTYRMLMHLQHPEFHRRTRDRKARVLHQRLLLERSRRLRALGPGQLSLVPSPAGALSYPEQRYGRLQDPQRNQKGI